MPSSELNQLQVACNDAHAAYQHARNNLATALRKSADHEVVANISASVEQYGLNATLKHVRSSDPKITEAIKMLDGASDNLSLAVSARELHLMKNNPSHQRAFVTDGREYRLDVGKSTITFLDDPGNPQKVDIQKLDKLPYYDIIELDGPDLNAPVISDDDDDDDDDSPKRRKGRGR